MVANGTKVKKNRSEKLEKPQELVYRYRPMTGKKAEKLNKQSNVSKFKIERSTRIRTQICLMLNPSTF